ncbi:hypothetical protein BD310DRAFT_321524 [Dichomitus squalens]|uniref:Uncharacterized protein n=1 Tax=Dichomitus squalens TaxID=114155 RepID=A0A4Q9Q0P4_9APHY|nr:hypothetical protein BD310DRAFT_321524 [Dichomitus squalens]
MTLVLALRAGRSACGAIHPAAPAVTSTITAQTRGYAAPAKPAKKVAFPTQCEERRKEEAGTAGCWALSTHVSEHSDTFCLRERSAECAAAPHFPSGGSYG